VVRFPSVRSQSSNGRGQISHLQQLHAARLSSAGRCLQRSVQRPQVRLARLAPRRKQLSRSRKPSSRRHRRLYRHQLQLWVHQRRHQHLQLDRRWAGLLLSTHREGTSVSMYRSQRSRQLRLIQPPQEHNTLQHHAAIRAAGVHNMARGPLDRVARGSRHSCQCTVPQQGTRLPSQCMLRRMAGSRSLLMLQTPPRTSKVALHSQACMVQASHRQAAACSRCPRTCGSIKAQQQRLLRTRSSILSTMDTSSAGRSSTMQVSIQALVRSTWRSRVQPSTLGTLPALCSSSITCSQTAPHIIIKMSSNSTRGTLSSSSSRCKRKCSNRTRSSYEYHSSDKMGRTLRMPTGATAASSHMRNLWLRAVQPGTRRLLRDQTDLVLALPFRQAACHLHLLKRAHQLQHPPANLLALSARRVLACPQRALRASRQQRSCRSEKHVGCQRR
jgi:hypothetical protein